jgi:hypothetical protein
MSTDVDGGRNERDTACRKGRCDCRGHAEQQPPTRLSTLGGTTTAKLTRHVATVTCEALTIRRHLSSLAPPPGGESTHNTDNPTMVHNLQLTLQD